MPELETRHCGWLTQPKEEAICATLNTLLGQTPSCNGQVGQRGQTLVRQRYTWASVAEQMAELYRWLSGGAFPVNTEVLQ